MWAHFRRDASSHGAGAIWAAGAGANSNSWQHLHGPREVVEIIDGLRFCFGPAAFRQPNLEVFERIVRDMKAALAEFSPPAKRPRRFLELCGGFGVLGLSLVSAAGPGATLLSTDNNAFSTESFAWNVRAAIGATAVDAGAAVFRCMDASEAALLADSGAFDVVVADPPRQGLGPKVIERVAAARSVALFLYLSCGPRTFSADAEGLLSGGFRLAGLRCYHSFPGTSHVEILGIFVRDHAFGHWRRPSIATNARI